MSDIQTHAVDVRTQIEDLFELKQPPADALKIVEQVIAGLNDGSITVVEKEESQAVSNAVAADKPVEHNQNMQPSVHHHTSNVVAADKRVKAVSLHTGNTGTVWRVNTWVKKAILLYFRLRPVEKMPGGPFYDKVPLKEFAALQTNRIVPYSSIRHGAYIAPGVVVMAPSFINIGAYVDTGSMIDSLVLVGSCARIGKNVHIGAGTTIGGVLEPPNSRPVIIEDNVFIGGNCGLYEGCLVRSGAVIAAGTVITAGTPIIDVESGREYWGEVPENAVVVPGGRLRTATGSSRASNGEPANIGTASSGNVASSNDTAAVSPAVAHADTGNFDKTTGQQFVLQTPLIIKYRDPSMDTKLALEESLRNFSG